MSVGFVEPWLRQGSVTPGRAAVLLAALALVAAPARAENLLFFDPPAVSTELPGELTLHLEMDFTDSTTGGGLEISYDPAVVALTGIAFDPALPDDPDFRCPGSTVIPCPGNPDFLSIGDFGGLSGRHRIASLVFEALGPGATPVSATIVNDFDDGTGTALDVGVEPGSILVPEPGQPAMLVAGGLALWVLQRRRHPARSRRPSRIGTLDR